MAGEFTKQTPYTHLCHLAQGGMGTVSLALRREGDFQRIYALKRLHPLVRDDAELRAMFLDEARIAGIIRHPNVVSVLDMGEDAEGPFLVMDYVDGLNLAQLIVDAKKQGELLPIQVAVRVALAVARGLHAAHEQVDHDGRPLAIVHRDLSPQNVLIGYAGTVSITDFGIAKALGRSAKTSTGVLKGKISYMSPEQLRFEEPDRRSDLFALGVILFEMLSGKRLYPHKGGNDVPRRILHEAPPDIGEFRPEVPPELVQLIFRLLAKSPDARPKSAAVAAQQLEGILASLLAEEDPIDLGPYVRDITGDRQTERRREIADLIAGAAVDDKDTIEFPLQQRLRSAASETVEPPRTKRRSRLALLGVIVVVLGVGVVALALVVPSADGEETNEPALPVEVDAPPPPEEPTSADTPTVEASAVEEDVTAAEPPIDVAVDSEEPPTVEEEPPASDAPRATSRSMRRRRRPRSMSGEMAMSSSDGLRRWQW
jgi:serine/threonine-protein kinase